MKLNQKGFNDVVVMTIIGGIVGSLFILGVFVYQEIIKQRDIAYINDAINNVAQKIVGKVDEGEIMEKDFLYGFKIVDFKGEKKIARGINIISESDINTFEVIDEYYSKDKNNVYLFSRKIEGADPQSFEVLKYQYAKDKNNVYYIDKIIEEADAASYEILTDSQYSKDKKNIYYQNFNTIENVDYNTFEVVNSNFAKDKNNAYYGRRIIDGADANTFEAINDIYVKDFENIYSFIGRGELVTLEKVDVNAFIPLEKHFGKDDNNVYYGGYLIEGADASTFKYIGTEYDAYAKDKNNVYCGQNIVDGADPDTFELPGR